MAELVPLLSQHGAQHDGLDRVRLFLDGPGRGMADDQALGHLGFVHARHHHVHEDQVDLVGNAADLEAHRPAAMVSMCCTERISQERQDLRLISTTRIVARTSESVMGRHRASARPEATCK